MKTWRLLIVAVGALAAPITLGAATDEVSPELARKGVSVLYEGYSDSGIKISKPKVYFNYDRTLKYYVFYFYGGPEEIPSWNDLERSIDDGKIPKGRWFSVIINGDRRLPPYFRFDGSPPRVISNKRIARELLERNHPEGDWRYTGAYIEGVEVFYFFRSGNREVITTMCGEIVNPEEARLDMDLLDQDYVDRNRQKWEEIEKSAEDPSLR